MQYLSIRYTERLAEAGIEASVGSKGDSYDNALAEAANSLFKAEVIYRRGPWKSREDVEPATLTWVDWFNNRRLLEPLGYVPPVEFETAYHDMQGNPPMVVGFNRNCLRDFGAIHLIICLTRFHELVAARARVTANAIRRGALTTD